jgi:hypothetical protein
LPQTGRYLIGDAYLPLMPVTASRLGIFFNHRSVTELLPQVKKKDQKEGVKFLSSEKTVKSHLSDF